MSSPHPAHQHGLTRGRIAALRQADPSITAYAMAKIIGVTEQRVRQLLVLLGLPTRVTPNS